MPAVTVTEHDTHTEIAMDDGKANAISYAMLEALGAALDEAQGRGRTIVLRGRNGVFSGGFDLAVMREGEDAAKALTAAGASFAERLYNCPLPVVGAVTGHALAMGALLLCTTDYNLGVSGDFKIGLNEVAIGMTLPIFGVDLVKQRLRGRHAQLSATQATIYTPDTAVEAGYLDRLMPDGDFDAALGELTERFGQLNLDAFAGTKARMREPVRFTVD